MLDCNFTSHFQNYISQRPIARKINLKYGDDMTGSTGQKCQLSGVYRCSMHPANTIPLSKGETFPPCSYGGGHAATWILGYAA
jgi:hypothetical protein